MPKEMLPIVDKPVLQYVVEEAVESGIEDILIITGRRKRAIENHFDHNPELEHFLQKTGKENLIPRIRELDAEADIYYIRQKEQIGLGDAVRTGRRHIGDEPFAVLLGDTLIRPAEGTGPGLRQLMDVFEAKEASVAAVHEVPRAWVGRYGIVDGASEDGRSDLVLLNRLVEKPTPAHAPSRLAIAGRYIFTPEIFDCIDHTEPGTGGEIQLTDAMNRLAQQQSVYALNWQAKRYDIGNRIEYAKCFLEYALRREDTGEAVRAHLRRQLEHMEAEA